MEKERLKALSKAQLENIILEMEKTLSKEQKQKLENMIRTYSKSGHTEVIPVQARMSQELVNEKMNQFSAWKRQIEDGELYLEAEEYEDYSSGYWDADWVTDYYDNQGVCDKIMSMIRFAKDCVEDRKYQEANELYEWLWKMEVSTDNEYSDSADLEMLEENDLIHTDMKELTLLTLYAAYQSLPSEKRAEDIYLYFSMSAFSKLHIEEMFHVGREELKETEQFWRDWIELLKSKNGDMEARLLKEAVLYKKGVDGLAEIAEENAKIHPSLYLAAIEEYEKLHLYEKIEETGRKAMGVLDVNLRIRGNIALKAGKAASVLQHEGAMMEFCFEGFRSDSSVENYLRLFGKEEMAEQYGERCLEVLKNRLKGNRDYSYRNAELAQNLMGDCEYHRLCFYMGEFEKVKTISKNPKGFLGWSGSFIQDGIRLFLLYLYDEQLPSKAAASIAFDIGFSDTKDENDLMEFERKILAESREKKVSEFWNYFQRWKKHFPMEEGAKKQYLNWAEKIVYGRADALVSGQHRNHYGQAAALLAMVAEIKESRGDSDAKREIFAEYKRKYPRHSLFQKEMKNYFNMISSPLKI